MSISTLMHRNGPLASPFFGASINSGVPISFAMWLPTVIFILLIGILNTLIQKGDRWNLTLPGLRSPSNHFNNTSLLSKDHELLSKTSIMCSSVTKTAKNKLFPISLIVTRWNPFHNCWRVDSKAPLLNSLLVCNRNKRLNWACSFDHSTS